MDTPEDLVPLMEAHASQYGAGEGISPHDHLNLPRLYICSELGPLYFSDVRQRFYQVPSLQDLFKTVKPEVILEFLKAAARYRLFMRCLNV